MRRSTAINMSAAGQKMVRGGVLGKNCLYVGCYVFMLSVDVCSLLLMFFVGGILGLFC